MEMRRETITLPYGEIDVSIGKCDFCGREWLAGSLKWIRIDVHEFTLKELTFDSYACAGCYFNGKSLDANEVIPSMEAVTNGR